MIFSSDLICIARILICLLFDSEMKFKVLFLLIWTIRTILESLMNYDNDNLKS